MSPSLVLIRSVRSHRGLTVLSCLLATGLSSPGQPGEICQCGFAGGPTFPVWQNGGTSALADLDGDGKLDLTTGESILYGRGDGTFSQPRELYPGDQYLIFDVAPVDLDGDGLLDLALAPMSLGMPEGSIVLAFGREPPSPSELPFEGPIVFPVKVGIWHLAVADLTGDQLPDIVAVGVGPHSTEEGSLPLLVNEGNRKFRTTYVGPQQSPGHPLAVGDLDGDGATDIVYGVGDAARILFGKGDGTFAPALESFLVAGVTQVMIHRFRTADLDGDGRRDLLAVAAEGFVLIYLGRDIDRSRGLPAQPNLVLKLPASGRFLEIADVNRDGLLDLVTQSAGDSGAVVQVFFGAGPQGGQALSFDSGNPFPATGSSRGAVLAVGDVDADGSPDIVITSEDTFVGQVFLNDGSCGLQVSAGDANADGSVDLSDPIVVLTHLFLGGELACPAAAEATGDDKLDISDPIRLLNHLFMGGDPPEGPEVRRCP